MHIRVALWSARTLFGIDGGPLEMTSDFFWPPLVKYKVKICPNWNFVINLIWNVLCSFSEHFKAAF